MTDTDQALHTLGRAAGSGGDRRPDHGSVPAGDDSPTAEAASPRSDDRDGERSRWRTALVDVGVIVGATVLILTWVVDLPSQPLRVPFSYSGDAVWAQANVKKIAETGWYTYSSHTGAPFGSNADDFPTGTDNLHFALIKGLTWFTHDAALVLNLYFLGSFLLVALSAGAALRLLGVSRAASVAAALVYTFAPYHFTRGQGHVFLAAYYAVPLGCLLVLRVLSDAPPFDVRYGVRRLVRRPATWGWIAVCAVLGSADGYYGLLTLVLAAVAGLLALATRRSWQGIVSAAITTALVLGVMAINLAPTILYHRAHGGNPEVAHRSLADFDHFGLRIVQMLMPIPHHRIDALSELTGRSFQAPNNSELTQFLGLIAVVGLGRLLVVALSGAAGGRRDAAHPLEPAAGALAIVAMLVASAGGLAWLIGLAGFVQVRAWNRISIFIAFFALFSLAVWFDQSRRRFARLRRPAVTAALLAAVVVIGVLDQTSEFIVPDARANAEAWHTDELAVRAVEQSFGRDASVFQLPYVPYPENPPVERMTDYDHLVGYLHSDSLHWSYGGMRGREADWQVAATRKPVPDMLDAVIAAGFDAVWVDRFGYADAGAELEGELEGLLGPPVVVSRDERHAVYDLRSRRSALQAELGAAGLAELRQDTLYSPHFRWTKGCQAEEDDDGGIRWCGATAEVDAISPRDDTYPGVLRFQARTASDATADLTVRFGDITRVVTIGPEPQGVAIDVTVTPDDNTIELSIESPPNVLPGDPSDRRVGVSKLTVEDRGAA